MAVQGCPYVVPWADRSEWRDVRNKITSDKVEDIIEAYEIMSVWRLRSSNLPAYIECTAGLLQVLIQEHFSETSSSLNDLRLCYSTAIIRFVNHVHNVSESRYNSLYSSAKIQNIPDWIITMRHDAAHGQNLPALETFHLAAKVSIEWLLKNYWFHKELYLNNLEQGIESFGAESLTSDVNLKLFPIYKKCIEIWEACCISTDDSLVSELSADKLYCISGLISLCKNNKYIKENGIKCESGLKKLSNCCDNSDKYRLKEIKRIILELIKYITIDKTCKSTFIHSILHSDFMLDFMQREWTELVFLIQTLKCFDIFLKSLFQLAANNNDVALDLLNSLASSIDILKRHWRPYREKFKKALDDKKKKMRIRKQYSNCYKNVRFALKLQKPPVIKLNLMQDLLRNPRERSKKIICKYLALVDPPLPEAILKEAATLIDIYCGTEAETDVTSDEMEKIYTLEDIKTQFEKELTVPNENTLAEAGTQRWNKSSINAETWSSCPLGLLPNQKTVNLTLPKNLECTSVESHSTRTSPLLTIQSAEMRNLRQLQTNVLD